MESGSLKERTRKVSQRWRMMEACTKEPGNQKHNLEYMAKATD
jgi:hypothetical protein